MFKYLASVVLVSAFVLSGCNTVQGVGKDITGTGNAIKRAATPDRHHHTNTQTMQSKSTKAVDTKKVSTKKVPAEAVTSQKQAYESMNQQNTVQ